MVANIFIDKRFKFENSILLSLFVLLEKTSVIFEIMSISGMSINKILMQFP